MINQGYVILLSNGHVFSSDHSAAGVKKSPNPKKQKAPKKEKAAEPIADVAPKKEDEKSE